jgi:putative ABC transport system substrate-binding protein
MKRRDFVALLGVAATAWPRLARAQQWTARPVRIGMLTIAGDPANETFVAFREELRKLGYIENQNCVFEFRSAPVDARLFATELVKIPVDIILTEGAQASLAAKQATTQIPIVMGVVGDPLATGLVSNLARPGGNITGFTVLAPELSNKRLALLKEAFPALKKAGILWNPTNQANGTPQVTGIQNAARTLGIAVEVAEAESKASIPAAFDRLIDRGATALIPVADNLFYNEHKLIADLVSAKRIPAIYPDRVFVNAGGLIFYGPDVVENFRRAAGYVNRVLKGTPPGDLPVQQPAKFQLVVNVKAAKALGLEVSPTLVLRADEIIE